MAKQDYRNLTKEQLIGLLEARERKRFGLVWERDSIEHDRALNEDFVVLDHEPDLSCGEGPYENLIIEGDNFDALRALRTAYAGQVKCIYIDPPYNTGNKDFVYNDRFIDKDHAWRHSMWIEFMYQRLMLAKDLLAEDGAIFVSIDDNEAHHLKLLMDEVFGASNFVATFVWRKVDSPNDNKVPVTPDHEFVIVYALQKSQLRLKQMPAPGILDAYRHVDSDGLLCRDRLLKKNGKNSLRRDRPTMFFKITDPDGNDVYPIHDNGEEACWAKGKTGVDKHIADKTLIWKKRGETSKETWVPYTREYPPPNPTRPYPTIWSDLPTMRQAKAMLREIFNTSDLFDTPKPCELISRIVSMATEPGDLILDFFAGSGTTAHSVLNINNQSDDSTRDRRFILVSSSEATGDSPKKNVCRDVCQFRVKRAVNGYGEVEGTGGSFAYLKTRRIPMNRVVRKIDHEQVWLSLQLMHFASYATDSPVAAKRLFLRHSEDETVFYLASLTKALLARLEKELAKHPHAVLYSWQPEAVEAHFENQSLTILPIPQTLIDRFGLRA